MVQCSTWHPNCPTGTRLSPEACEVALALTCEQGGPCEHPHIASDDPAIAEVRPASLAALQQVGFTMQIPASAFVVIGKAPGTTKLHVRTKKGKRDIVVTVVAPPPPANEQTVAKQAE